MFWSIIRKLDFRLLRIKIIPRRRILFLCSLYIGATTLLLWR